MLNFLTVSDFVIVDRIELEFQPGFTVLLPGKPAPASESSSTP